MLDSTRNDWIRKLEEQVLSLGNYFESFGGRFIEWTYPGRWQHRGMDVVGNPVKGAVDSSTTDGIAIAEYSTEAGYFTNYKKPISDLRNARAKAPQARRIILVAGRSMGPTRATWSARLSSRVKRWMRVDLEIYDARRIAETIVDDLFDNDRALEDLESFLPALVRARQELAATNLVPTPSAGSVAVPHSVRALADLIAERPVLIITGLSGSGKSELVASYARGARSEYDAIVWLQEPTITSVSDLSGVDVTPRDQHYNVSSMLADRACLLVLDHYEGTLAPEDLRAICGPRSRIVITRQWSDGSAEEWPVPLLDPDTAKEILQAGIEVPCPADLRERVWATVGGHPLSLRLLNVAARRDGWAAIEADLTAIGEFFVEDRTRKLAARLLDRWRDTLERELAFFLWCANARVDRGYARAALRHLGVRSLEDACVLATDRADLLRLHDIVWHVLHALGIRVELYAEGFSQALERYVEGLAAADDSRLPLLNLAYTHQAQFERLLAEDGPRDAYVYCLLHARQGSEAAIQAMGDPLSRAEDVARRTGPISDLAVSVPLEMVEFQYRLSKKSASWDAAQAELRQNLSVFDVLETAKGLSSTARSGIRHHRAKALVNLKEREAALAIWRELLDEPEPFPAVRGLYARHVSKDGAHLAEAREILFGILRDVHAGEGIGLSVALAAVEDLCKGKLEQFLPDATATFGDVMAEQIVAAVSRGFGQGFVTFAALGRKWAYNEPERFMHVYRRIPPRRPTDPISEDERRAWGDILLSAYQHLPPEERASVALLGAAFLASLQRPNTYSERQRGYALSLAERYDEAARVFAPLVERDPDAWVLHRYSQFLLSKGEYDESLRRINDAIEKLPSGPKYRAAFLSHRFAVRQALGDPSAVQDLRLAIEVCDNPKYRRELEQRLLSLDNGDNGTLAARVNAS